jgi:hypothetical protein
MRSNLVDKTVRSSKCRGLLPVEKAFWGKAWKFLTRGGQARGGLTYNGGTRGVRAKLYIFKAQGGSAWKRKPGDKSPGAASAGI